MRWSIVERAPHAESSDVAREVRRNHLGAARQLPGRCGILGGQRLSIRGDGPKFGQTEMPGELRFGFVLARLGHIDDHFASWTLAPPQLAGRFSF